MSAQDFNTMVLEGYQSLIEYCMPLTLLIACVNISCNIIINAFMGRGIKLGRWHDD